MRENLTIEELGLSVRQYNCLKREGINTLKELKEMTVDDLLKVRNLNKRNIDDLIEKGYININMMIEQQKRNEG